MKIVYTPKDRKKYIDVSANTERYNCDAYDYFREKRKDDLTEIVNEINRREKEKYHMAHL